MLLKTDPEPKYERGCCRCKRLLLTDVQHERLIEIRDFITGCILSCILVLLLVTMYRDEHMYSMREKASNLTDAFNVSQIAEYVTALPTRDAINEQIERMKYRFVYSTLLTGSKSDFVCMPMFYPISMQAISDFEDMLIPYFQLSNTLSSVSELCFVKN